MGKIRVVVIGPLPIVCDGIVRALDRFADVEIVGQASSADEAVTMTANLSPDVIVIDTTVPELQTLTVLKRVKKTRPEIAVVAIVDTEDDELMELLVETHLSGLLPRKPGGDDLFLAIRAAHIREQMLHSTTGREFVNGKRSVSRDANRSPHAPTGRELQVLKLVCKGLTSREIASELGCKERTIKGHLSNLFMKLQVRSRTELVFAGLRLGFLSLADVFIDAPESTKKSGLDSETDLIDDRPARLVEQINEGCVLVQDEKFVFVNRKMAEMLGYSRSELIGRPFVDILLPELRERVWKGYRAWMTGAKALEFFYIELLRNDGSKVPATFSVRVASYRARPASVGIIFYGEKRREPSYRPLDTRSGYLQTPPSGL